MPYANAAKEIVHVKWDRKGLFTENEIWSYPDFWAESGWTERCCAMISGRALNNCCQARPVIGVARPRTIGGSLDPSSGSCVPVVPGATCLPSSDIGIGRMYASPAGTRRRCSSALPRPCAVTLTWSTCSSIRPSCAPTSTAPAPKKAGSQEIGRSRGGLTTKLHVAVDSLGNPLRVILSAGQIADIDYASALIENLPGQAVMADKGYDTDHFVATIEAAGAQAVIPPRSNRLTQRDFDRHLYRDRNLIERFFARIRHLRRIATRYDKLAKSFLSFVHLACTFVWLA